MTMVIAPTKKPPGRAARRPLGDAPEPDAGAARLTQGRCTPTGHPVPDRGAAGEGTAMPKNKTHSGTAKRVKVTGSGKLMRQQAGLRHRLEVKSSKETRDLVARRAGRTRPTSSASRSSSAAEPPSPLPWPPRL